MGTSAQTNIEVSQLYVALFGRAPDYEGLAFWAALRNSGQSVAELANAMFGTAPARVYFPEGLGAQEVIASFYLNVLGRVADSEGLLFWTRKLEAAGATPGSVIAEMISVIASYAGPDAAGLASAALYNNRVEAARFYGEHNGSIAGAKALLAGITSEAQTVVDARVLSIGDRVSASIDASGVGEVVVAHVQDQVNLTGIAHDTALRFTFETQFFPVYVPQGKVVAQMAKDTSNDKLEVVFSGTYSDDQDGLREGHLVNINLDTAGVEVIEVVSSAEAFPSEFATDADFIANALRLNDPDLQTLIISGTQPLTFDAGPEMVNLRVVDARNLTGHNMNFERDDMGLSFWGSLLTSPLGLTVLGSATNDNFLVGTLRGDVIVGGSGNGVIAGDGINDLVAITGSDILTGGGGNDDFLFSFAAESRSGRPDKITDFVPNTVARGGEDWRLAERAPTDASLRNGDVISLPPSEGSHLAVAVFGSAVDARAFLATMASYSTERYAAALDSGVGRLYVDITYDGVADMAINLPGVSTITAAAFF